MISFNEKNFIFELAKFDMPITPNVIWECLKNVLFTSADPMQDISERLEREKKEFINCMFYVSLFLSSQKKYPSSKK